MKGFSEKTDRNIKTIKTILIVAMIIAALAVSKAMGNVSVRLLLSIFIFVLVLPLVSALEKVKFPGWLATLIAVLVIVVVLVFFLWFVFFTVDMLIKKVPAYGARINDLDGVLKSLFSRWIEFPEEVSFFSTLDIDWVGSLIMPALRTVSSSAISIMSNVLLIVLMTVFLLMERHTIVPKIINLIADSRSDIFEADDEPDPRGRNVSTVWDRIVRQVSRYISIKVFVSIITGLLFYVVCSIVKLDFAILWAVLAVVLNFIPTIGSIVITVLVTLMAVIQFAPNWGPILFVGIGALVIQNAIGNFLDPKLSGNSLNLSPFVILVALGIAGYIWGIVGMFLAVPMLSIVQIICANVEDARPVAMAISSGGSFKRASHSYGPRKKGMFKTPSRKGTRKGQDYGQLPDDFMFPDKQ